MILQENLSKEIEIVGFKRIGKSMIYSKSFGSLDCVMEADMKDSKPTYPKQTHSI